MLLQSKLDDICLKRAEGASIRSRAKWMEEGEKNSSYFSRLEKKRQDNKATSSLLINGSEFKDRIKKIIEKEVLRLYSNLYSSEFSPAHSMSFFAQIENFKAVIDETFRELCDSDLLLEELDAVCLGLPLNKAPGTDGLKFGRRIFS